MEIVQIYETTVADRDQGHAFRFLTIPARSLGPDQHLAAAKDALVELLGLHDLRPLRPSSVHAAIMGMLDADDEEELQELQARAVLDSVLQTTPTPSAAATLPPSDLLSFAEQIAFSNLIPFEESPISLVSLAGKAASLAKSPIALGAFIGVIAGGPTVLLLLTVPAGIILCGTATSIVKAVDARRDEIMSKVLGISPKTEQKPAPTPRRRMTRLKDEEPHK